MIDFAYAADAAAQPANNFQSFLPLILIMVAAYFLLMRPMSKQRKAAEKMISTLEKNDEVVLATGIVGKITRIGEQFITVEIAPNTEICVQKHANVVAQKLEKGSLKKITKGISLQPEKKGNEKKALVKKEEEAPKEETNPNNVVEDFNAKAAATSFSDETQDEILKKAETETTTEEEKTEK